MKKFEEANLEVMLVKNTVITTSGGCTSGMHYNFCHGAIADQYVFNSEADSSSCPAFTY